MYNTGIPDRQRVSSAGIDRLGARHQLVWTIEVHVVSLINVRRSWLQSSTIRSFPSTTSEIDPTNHDTVVSMRRSESMEGAAMSASMANSWVQSPEANPCQAPPSPQPPGPQGMALTGQSMALTQLFPPTFLDLSRDHLTRSHELRHCLRAILHSCSHEQMR